MKEDQSTQEYVDGVHDSLVAVLKNINRPGIPELIKYLEEKTDFFTAPASTKYHSSFPGGLAVHSFNVMNRIDQLMRTELASDPSVSEDTRKKMLDSAVLVAILHDVAKTNFYELSKRNVKIDGNWQEVNFYKTKDDILGYGHGEESVYIVSAFIRLTREEAFAIRFHMGDFEDRNTSRAYAKYPLALHLHLADMMATYLDESRPTD